MSADLVYLGLFETLHVTLDSGVELFQIFQCTNCLSSSSPAVLRAIIIKADSQQVVHICPCVFGGQMNTPGVFDLQTYLPAPLPQLGPVHKQ